MAARIERVLFDLAENEDESWHIRRRAAEAAAIFGPGPRVNALIQRGAWVAIRSRRSDERWRVVLPEILEREGAFLGLDKPCTRVVVCAQGEFDTRMHDAWRAHAMSYRDLALATE